MVRRLLLAAAVVCAIASNTSVIAAQSSNANTANQLVISSASNDGTYLFVTGANFGTAPVVFLNGIPLADVTVGNSGTTIVALLPGLPPGTYLLHVSRGSANPQNGTLSYTLGAVGATGATGATGAQGPAGDVGPMGPIGPAGPAGPQGIAGITGLAGLTCPAGQFMRGFTAAGGLICGVVTTTLDFNALEVNDSSLTPVPGGTYTEDLYTITGNLYYAGQTHPDLYAGSAGLHTRTSNGVIALTGPSGFTMVSIDLSILRATFSSPAVTFTGTKIGGGTVTATFTPLTFGFQTFTFPASFDNLTSVTWNQGRDNLSAHQFDNIRVAP